MAESEVLETFVENDNVHCDSCGLGVVEPYIRCAMCGPSFVNLCTICFSNGCEFDIHENNHPYVIIRSNFPLLTEEWVATDEIHLLDLINDRGLGNWRDISQQLQNKTPAQCETHYLRTYITHTHSLLPKFPEASIQPHKPILFKLSDDPPRPKDRSTLAQEMAGYSAARGDVTVEADNYVEMDLNSMELDESCGLLERELNEHVVSIYWNCLRERQRKKDIVRDYGIINLRKTHSCNIRYQRTLGLWVDGLRVFMHLLPPDEYIKFLELLKYEKELQKRILSLMELRENGVTRLRNAPMYESLKSQRVANMTQKQSLLTDILDHIQDESACQSWLQNQQVLQSITKGVTPPLPSVPRKSAPPLEITGLPGYDRLTDVEKRLCKSARFVPGAYLEFKSILINEYSKIGNIRLAQARVLLKIDVNKTRKLYDFLISQGYINTIL